MYGANLLLNNSAEQGNGGHIMLASSKLFVYNASKTDSLAELLPVFSGQTTLNPPNSKTRTSGTLMSSGNALSGGSIFCLNSKFPEFGVHVSGGTVIQSSVATSLTGGGGISATVCDLDLETILLSNNRALNGGAAHIGDASRILISNSRIFGNHASFSGGALECDLCDAIHLVNGNIFKENVAGDYGGAISAVRTKYSNDSSFNSTFRSNMAGQGGGAVRLINENQVGQWKGTKDTFSKNLAKAGSGGAFSALGTRVEFDRKTICEGNRAPYGGGGCLFWEPLATMSTPYLWENVKPIIRLPLSHNEAAFGSGIATGVFQVRISNVVDRYTSESGKVHPAPVIHLLDFYNNRIIENRVTQVDAQAALRDPKVSGTHPVADTRTTLSGAQPSTITTMDRAGKQNGTALIFDSLAIHARPGSGPHTISFQVSLNLNKKYLQDSKRNFTLRNSLQVWIKNCSYDRNQYEYDGICLFCPAKSQPVAVGARGPATESCSCLDGYTNMLKDDGMISCSKPQWLLPHDCSSREYLDNRNPSKYNHTCEKCPPGGACASPEAKWTTLRPLFGWWKFPEQEQRFYSELGEEKLEMFAECIYPPSCLGGQNDALSGKGFVDENGEDLALKSYDANATCRVGYDNSSRLCNVCSEGYFKDVGGACISCMEDGSPLLFFFGVLFGIAWYVILICLRLRSFSYSGKFDHAKHSRKKHTSLKRIALNHLQTLSMVLGLSVPWPHFMVKSIFAVGSTMASFSQHAQVLQCYGVGTRDPAVLHYMILVICGALPLVGVAILAFVWLVLVRICINVFGCCSRGRYQVTVEQGPQTMERQARFVASTFDMFVFSCVLMWYLLLPGLMYMCSNLFKCIIIGDARANIQRYKPTYLRVSLEEECWTRRHTLYALLMGMPIILIHTACAPLLMLLHIYRAGDQGRMRPKMLLRFGLLYRGFRKDRFWFEGVNLLRKALIVAAYISSESDVEQIQLVQVVIFCALLVHVVYRPFGEMTADEDDSVLHYVEMQSLVILLFVLWCGSYFVFISDRSCRFVCVALAALILVSNVAFILKIFRNACWEYVKKSSETSSSKASASNSTGNQVQNPMVDFQHAGTEIELACNPSKTGITIEIHIDSDTGCKFLFNKITEQTVWFDDEDDGFDEIRVDERSGQQYMYDSTSGDTKWIDETMQNDWNGEI